MAMTYDKAVEVQRVHERRLLDLDGVNAVGVKLAETGPVLEITVDPERPLPAEVSMDELDGLPVRIVRARYTLQ